MPRKAHPNIDHLRESFFEGLQRYRYLETLGKGAMGVVFRVEDLELGEEIAIKVLLSSVFELEDENDPLARFKRETNLNRRVKHANVARIHDFGVVGEFRYLTMEYVPGRDLARLIHEKGVLPPDFVVPVLRQVALGTAAAHKLGIVHRDLKSENIMVDAEGGVALLDFGTARRKLDPTLTREGDVVGTITHMSPEQLQGREADARCDIYSIRVVAYNALTGHTPFARRSTLATAPAIINDPVPTSDLQAVPPELVAIVLRCLAKKPEERYATAEELERDLALLTLPRNGDGPRPAMQVPIRGSSIEPPHEIELATAPVRVTPPDTRKAAVLVVAEDDEFAGLAAPC